MHISKPSSSKLPWSHFALLTLMVVAHGLSNYTILELDNIPRVRHDAYFFKESYEVLNYWIDLDLAGRFSMKYPYPLLFIDIATPFFILFGHTPDVGAMSNLIYTALLVFSLYGLCSHLFSESVGLLSAFMAVTSPHLFGMSRNFTLDYPMTAMVVLAFWALVKSEFYRSRPRSLFLGVCIGLGVSTKTVFLVTFLGPFLYYCTVSFLKPLEDEASLVPARERALNLLLALSIASGIAVLWNGSLWHSLVAHIRHCIGVELVNELRPFNYLQELYCVQLLVPYATLFLLGLLSMAAGRKRWPHYVLLLWIGIPFLVFTFIIQTNQDPRFTLPVLPAASVVTALFLLLPSRKWIRAGAVAIVVLFGLFQYGLLFFFPLHARAYNRINKRLACDELVVSDHVFPYSSWQRGLLCPREADLPIDQILDTLTAAHRRAGRAGTRCPVLVLSMVRPNQGYLHDILINASLSRPGSDLHIDFFREHTLRSDEAELVQALSEFDYVVYTEVRINADPSPEELSLAAGTLLDHIDRYRLLNTFEWIDGREISVYQSKALNRKEGDLKREPAS